MIVALSCSTSWCQTSNVNIIPSTGEREQIDTLISVPISTIKSANAKMVELKYEKEINAKLKTIIKNDSLIIKQLNINLEAIKNEAKSKITSIKKQRNCAIGTSLCLIIILILL